MLQKLTCILICCLSLTMVTAQSTKMYALLDSMDKGIAVILKDQKVAACHKNLRPYKDSFKRGPGAVLKKTDIDLLKKSCDAFVKSVRDKSTRNCYGPQTKELAKKADNLIQDLIQAEDKWKAIGETGDPGKDSSKNSTGTVVLPADARMETDSMGTVGSQSANDSLAEQVIGSPVPDPENLAVEVSNLSKSNTLLQIAAGTLFALSALLAILYVRKGKNAGSTRQEPEEPLVDVKETAPLMQEETRDIDEAPLTAALINVEPPAKPAIADAEETIHPAKPGLYFVCELMMTAGPRKKFMGEENADKDLGEDVCGFVSDPDKVLIWLLDGTSDLHCLKNPVNKREYFSSRLLALGIAEKLRGYFMEGKSESIGEMVSLAIEEVKLNWLDVIGQLPREEQAVLRYSIENKNFPECAATILIAALSLKGDFTAYRSGDSKMFLFSSTSENGVNFVETSLEQKNDKSNDRIFFRLRLNEQGEFDIKYNEPHHEIVRHNNISTIISFSDGIGSETEQLLKEEYKNAPDQTRKEIIYHAQETGDDKTICFIEIKESR